MFLVSGTDLVAAACRNGVIGAFPTVNCRIREQLDGWLGEIEDRLRQSSDASGKPAAPVCPNLIVHRSNARLEADLQVLLRHRPEIVITSVGSPAPVLAPLHDAGALVFADVASIRHAGRAVAAGADGLVLLTAQAFRPAGSIPSCSSARCARSSTDPSCWRRDRRRPPACGRRKRSAAISPTWAPSSSTAAGAAGRPQIQGDAGCESSADDILLTTAFTGLQTNMLRPSIAAAELDPENLPLRGAIDIAKDIDIGTRENRPARWRDVWSAGHSTSGVTDVLPVDELVARTLEEYRAAKPRG